MNTIWEATIRNMRTAAYWSRFDGSPTECVPTNQELDAFKNAGFTWIRFGGEARYNKEMEDFDLWMAGTPNPLKAAADYAHSIGLKVETIKNVNRYGDKATFISDSVRKAKFIMHCQYASTFCDAIQLEEPTWQDRASPACRTEVNTLTPIISKFFRDIRAVLPSGYLFSINSPANELPNVIGCQGWDLTVIREMFDYVAPQPGSDTKDFTDAEIQGCINKWVNENMPNFPIAIFVYKSSYKGLNNNVVSNLETALKNGLGSGVWPATDLKYAVDLPLIKAVFAKYPLIETPPPPVETGTVTVDTIPHNAAVLFDGGHYGFTPRGAANPILNIPPGTYTMELTLQGFQPIIDPNVQVFAGQNTDKKYNLVPVTGTLYISSLPVDGARIFIDNIDTLSVTPATIPVSPGIPHTIRLVLPGYKDFTESNIIVSADQTMVKIYSLLASGKGAAGTVITVSSSLIVATTLYGIGKLLKR